MDGSKNESNRLLNGAPGSRAPSALLLGLCLACGAAIALRHITVGEFNINTDETIHACSSLFFTSLLRDLPFAHPIQYTYRYYAQYPALGLVQYPPFFYLVEGFLFLLFGPSVVVARLGILLFTLAGGYFWFRLVEECSNRWTAALSAILLFSLPGLLLFEKAVMLEIPSLALCIAAGYFWIRYLRESRTRLLYLFALTASLALLTKQNAVYLPVFCLFSLLAEKKWKMLWGRHALAAFAGVCVLVGPMYLTMFAVEWRTIRLDMAQASASSATAGGQWLFYLKTLPGTLGWPLLALAVLGILTCRWWGDVKASISMLAWIPACYVTLSLIKHQETRYICYWLPPFAYFAAAPLTSGRWKGKARLAGGLLAAVLVAAYAGRAWAFERPYVSGYAAAAKALAQTGYSGVVLADMELPGNFIFFVRASDPEGHIVVMRKGLYVERIEKSLGDVILVNSREQLLSLLGSYGVKYIVVEENIPLDYRSQKILRQLLQDPRFRDIGDFPIASNKAWRKNRSLRIYEDTESKKPTATEYRVKMLTMGHDIVVPMSQLLR